MIEEVLKSRIGLNIDSIGMKKIDADISRRMKECGINDRKEYIKLLESSKEEFKELVDIITVPETWFFRSKDSFDYLEDYIRVKWFAEPGKKLKVLSIPCSTGEEPYSIAITLLKCGLKYEDFSVEGADINSASLKKASKAVYSKNSFRGLDADFKKRYFKEKNGLFELDEKVRKTVSFFFQNLLEFFLPPLPENKYDIIFCRNMLIYFDEESQRKAVDILTRLLKENGLLFLGHAETGILLDSNFVPVKAKGSFAFRKLERGEKKAPSLTDTQKIYRAELERQLAARKRKYMDKQKRGATKVKTRLRKEPKPENKKIESILEKAQTFADRGMLAEAEKVCRDYIAENKLDAEAYFLMGLITMSLQKYSEAEGFFNKAVYLKPEHYDALINLSTIRERAGDYNGARRFRERAERTGGLKQ